MAGIDWKAREGKLLRKQVNTKTDVRKEGGSPFHGSDESHSTAVTLCSIAMDAMPTTSGSYIARAWAYSRVKRFNEALVDITVAIQMEAHLMDIPKLSNLLSVRSQFLRSLKRWWEAARDLIQAVRLAPDNALYILDLAQVYNTLGRHGKAWGLVQSLLTLGERSVNNLSAQAKAKLYSVKGKCELSMRHPELAVDSFEKALEFDGSSSVHNNLAAAHFLLGQFSGAAINFQRACDSSSGNHRYLRNLALCFYQLGRYEDAVQAFDTCISQEKNDPSLFIYRATAKLAMKEYAGAESDAKTVVSMNDKLDEAYYILGQLHLVSGRPEQCVTALKRSLECSISLINDEKRVCTLLSLGVSHHQLGELFDALKCFTSTIEISAKFSHQPKNTMLQVPSSASDAFDNVRDTKRDTVWNDVLRLGLFYVASVYFSLAYYGLASRSFQQAMSQSASMGERNTLQYFRGVSLLLNGDLTEALENFEALENSADRQSVPFTNLHLFTALALYRTGKYREAAHHVGVALNCLDDGDHVATAWKNDGGKAEGTTDFDQNGNEIGNSTCSLTTERAVMLFFRGVCFLECKEFLRAECDATAALETMQSPQDINNAYLSDEDVQSNNITLPPNAQPYSSSFNGSSEPTHLVDGSYRRTLGEPQAVTYQTEEGLWEMLYLRGLSRAGSLQYDVAIADLNAVLELNPEAANNHDFVEFVGTLRSKVEHNFLPYRAHDTPPVFGFRDNQNIISILTSSVENSFVAGKCSDSLNYDSILHSGTIHTVRTAQRKVSESSFGNSVSKMTLAQCARTTRNRLQKYDIRSNQMNRNLMNRVTSRGMCNIDTSNDEYYSGH